MNVVGIRFKPAGKIYYFDAKGLEFTYKEKAVLSTENGVEIGEIALTNIDIEEEKFNKKLKPVLRKANENDIKKQYINKLDSKDAEEVCQDLADRQKLGMKVVDANYTLDRSKLTIYFTADKRVDFRSLVKELAATFKSRIELRQIGVRDHAKLIKHHGSCGQQCCCSRHLTDFTTLSIKYAKDQNISLDPNKISGVCGRLMCCLSYEEDYYLEAKKIMPKYGQRVRTEDGEGMVVSSDLVRSCCKVKVKCEQDDEHIEKVYSINDLERIN